MSGMRRSRNRARYQHHQSHDQHSPRKEAGCHEPDTKLFERVMYDLHDSRPKRLNHKRVPQHRTLTLWLIMG